MNNNSFDFKVDLEPQDVDEIENFEMLNDNMIIETTNTEVKERKIYSGFSFADCCKNPTPQQWLIKGYLPKEGLVMIFAPSESAKSFVALDMAISIASPEIETWHGKKLRHGDVIYFAGEDSIGVRKRCAGWAVKRGINPENVKLKIIDEVFQLDNTQDKEHSIEITIKNIREISSNPALVVFDTLNRFMAGDENRSDDTGNMLQLFARIITELKTTVTIVHHTGVGENAQNRARGSSAWRGAVDIELKISKNENEVTVEQTKNKNGAHEQKLVFDLTEITIPNWIDEDGDPVTTCTLELNDFITQLEATKPPKEKKPAQSEITARKTYSKAAKKHGVIIKDKETGSDIVAVSLDKWREAFYENSSADNVDSKRRAFDRARKKLTEEKEVLRIQRIKDNDYYCLIDNSTPDAQEIRRCIDEENSKRENCKLFTENSDLYLGQVGQDKTI